MGDRFVQHDANARRQVKAGKAALVWRAALKLFEDGRGDFILESVEGGSVRGRYSLIGIAPDLLFRSNGTAAEINRHWLTDRDAFAPADADTMTALRQLVQSCRIDMPPELPPAFACLVGHFGYETIGLVEKLPRPPANPIGLPDMMFVRPTVVLVFDRLADRLYIASPIWPEGGSADQLIERGLERIECVAAKLAQPVPPIQSEQVEGLPDPKPAMPPTAYQAMVLKAKDYIAAGDIFQVVLAQRFTLPFALPAIDLYRALRRINPSPFLYHLDMPGFALIGSSPEILVRVRDGVTDCWLIPRNAQNI
jgi:anthranilate synthase component I